MQTWIATGISGSGRIELLEDIKTAAEEKGRSVGVHDLGALIREEAERTNIDYSDKRILDSDRSLLRCLRAAALKEVTIRTLRKPDVDLHLVGMHATFRWKRRLMPGISYSDLIELNPDGLINVVDDVKDVIASLSENPKYSEETRPNMEQAQDWMAEEEFITEVLAEVLRKPMYLVARKHHAENLADLFFTKKKKIYLSYPITAVRKENPDLLARIQGPVLDQLQKKFVVFNPLSIKDMHLTYSGIEENLPELVNDLTPQAKDLIKTRTVERDYQFIDQSDAIVVYYLTDKLSAGVFAEVLYAHRNQKPIFMCYKGAASPFMEDVTYVIEKDIENLMERLNTFAAE